MSAVAALVAGLAWWLGWEPPEHRLARRLRPPVDLNPASAARHRGDGVVVTLGGGAAVALAGAAWGSRGVALTLCAVMLAATVGGLATRHRRRAGALKRREDVVRAGEVLAGLLRVGQVPATALVAAARESDALAEAAALQEIGGDVVPALLVAAREPGSGGLADLARAWQVAARTGASMCDSIEAASTRLLHEQEAAETVRAELAAPQASGRLMGLLPLAGLGLGYLFGGDPVGFLGGNAAGQVCLVVGVGLACAGLGWSDRIAEGRGTRGEPL